MTENHDNRLMLAVALIVLGAAGRLLPHAPNFTPIGALALFAGAELRHYKVLRWVVPIAAMILSDLLLGFHSLTAVVYASLALIVPLGFGLEPGRMQVGRIGLSSLGGAVVFFVLSNLGVWVEGVLYPRSLAGLESCFVAALPFFTPFAAATFVYTTGMFGVMAGLERAVPSLRRSRPLFY